MMPLSLALSTHDMMMVNQCEVTGDPPPNNPWGFRRMCNAVLGVRMIYNAMKQVAYTMCPSVDGVLLARRCYVRTVSVRTNASNFRWIVL